ncbi:MAG: hypothetical protein ACLU4N_07050 [Butyricimonas faecihominis]
MAGTKKICRGIEEQVLIFIILMVSMVALFGAIDNIKGTRIAKHG